MAKMYLAIKPFSLRSTWTNIWDDKYYIRSTTPSIAQMAVSFGCSAIPTNAKINSAILRTYATQTIGGGVFKIDDNLQTQQIDVTAKITPNADGSFNDLVLTYSFQAYGNSGASAPKGTRSTFCNVQESAIEVDYTASGSESPFDADAYRAAALAPSRIIQPRGTIKYADGTTQPINWENIIGFDINEGLNTGILLGTATSSMLEMRLANADGEWFDGGGMRGNRPLIGAKITMEIGLLVADKMVFSPAGTFTIEEVTGDEDDPSVYVVGYDEMANKLHEKFDDDGIYPASLNDVLNRIVGKTGMPLRGVLATNRTVMIPSVPDWGEECTLRQALAFVCGAGASYAIISRDGYIDVKPTWDSAVKLTLNPENYITSSHDERTLKFNRIVVSPRKGRKKTDNVVSAIDDSIEELPSNTIYIKDNPLFVKGQEITQGMVDTVKTALIGAEWGGTNIVWRGDPTVTVGTRFDCTLRSGRHKISTIMGQSIEWEQGFHMTASCGIETREVRTGAITGGGMIDSKKIAVEAIASPMIANGAITVNKIAPEVGKSLDLSANTSVSALENSSISIGKDIILKALGDLIATAGGNIQLRALIGNNSFIDFPNFKVAANGEVTATNFHSTTFKVGGHDVLTDTDLIQSENEPQGVHGVYWVKPNRMTKKVYTHKAVGEENITETGGSVYDMVSDDTATLSGTDFKYKFVCVVDEYIKNRGTLNFDVELYSGGDVVDMGRVIQKVQQWGTYTLEFNATSAINVTASPVTFRLKVSTSTGAGLGGARGLRFKPGNAPTLTVSSNVGGGVVPCELFYIS